MYKLTFYLSILLGFTSVAIALDPRTNLLDGASMQVHDYHCTCRKLGNSTGKNVFFGWKTSGEWASFYNSAAVAGITKSSCIGVVPSHPSLSIADTPISNCSTSTGYHPITNVDNSGGYSLKVNIPAGYALAAADCYATYNYNQGSGPVFGLPLFAGMNTISVCSNSEISFTFYCNYMDTHGPYTISVYQSDGTTLIDSFRVEFQSVMGGSCDLIM